MRDISLNISTHIIDIFSRITKLGYEGTMKLLANPIEGVKQKDADANAPHGFPCSL